MPCSDINSVLNLCLGFCDYELERTKTDSQSANFAPLHCIEPFTLSGEGERINSFYIFGKSLEKKWFSGSHDNHDDNDYFGSKGFLGW